MNVLISWLGYTDFDAGGCNFSSQNPGGVMRLLRHLESFDHVYLLNDIFDVGERAGISAEEFCRRLFAAIWPDRPAAELPQVIHLRNHPSGKGLKNDYEKAFTFTCAELTQVRQQCPGGSYSMHLSSGHPAAQFAMVLAAQTLFESKATLYNTKPDPRGPGVELAKVPYVLSVDFVESAARRRFLAPPADEPIDAAFAAILGESDAIKVAKLQAALRAKFPKKPVLFHGETGTGKTMLAQAMHKASSRRDKAFLHLNCANFSEHLLESELFGHEKGAFTGAIANRTGILEQAHDGTVFLDEVGEASLLVQAKLLTFLDSGEFMRLGGSKTIQSDVWVITATHRNLPADVRGGRFRMDLYYRLNAEDPLVLPPLRLRGHDRRLLAQRFLSEFNRDNAKNVRFAENAVEALSIHTWPGNIRELKNAVENLAIKASDAAIAADDVLDYLQRQPFGPGEHSVPLSQMNTAQLFSQFVAHFDELLQRFAAMLDQHRQRQVAQAAVQPLPTSPDVFVSIVSSLEGPESKSVNVPSFTTHVLEPLFQGRALAFAQDNLTTAGLLGNPSSNMDPGSECVKRSKHQDRIGKPDAKWRQFIRCRRIYDEILRRWIDEQLVRTTRGY